MNNTSTPQEPTTGPLGSRDGTGSGDNDTPYVFGRRPRAIAPFPFTTREYARLVVLRGRVQDGLAAGDRTDDMIANSGWRPAAA
jgi:hypothetical protein